MLRIVKALHIFDVNKIMRFVKRRYQQKIQNIIDTDFELANNVDIDNNKIEEILWVTYVMDTIKLIIFIINITYLTAIVWLIVCEAVKDYYGMVPGEHNEFSEEDPDFFMVHFGFEQRSPSEALIIGLYFAFTSLSTVGFGDFHPRSN